jgi:peptidoglycan hydrolase-like protein with peptidoglycan-binding domain
MSRHHKTFAPRTSWFEAQTLDNEEAEKKYAEISSQDATISLAKNEVTQLTHDLFNNRAFNKIEKNQSVLQFSNEGLHVQTLNKALNELGYKTKKNETLFWNHTKSQLMNFQRDYGVKTSGILDAKTLLKMDEVLGKARDEEKEKKTKKSSNILSSQLEKAKVNNPEDSDTITHPITIAKNQKFNSKIIQTDEELNRFAEYRMGITRELTWKPAYTKEQVKNIIDNGGTVNYTISAKTNSIEKETETLSPNKKQFIRNAASSVDYIQNIRILDLLHQLSDEEIADYKNKVTEETNDLKTIEESLKEYIKNRNLRNKEKTTREKLQNQLSKPELSDLYKQYTNYIKFKHSHENTFYEPKDPNKVYFQNALDKQLQDLLASLKANGFTLESFKKLIKDYEIAFRKETVHIAEDSLIRYKHILFEQKKKLLEDTFLIKLLEKIKTSKAEESYDESDKATPLFYDNKLSAAEREFKMKMEERARSKKAEGNAAIENLSSNTPLVKDNGFNKEGFAKLESKQELRSFLESYINDQEGNITKITAKLQSNQGLSIYGFASLLQKSKEQQGIANDSIFDLIVTDKEDEESTKHIIEGLLIGVLAVALGLLSFGTGTVAVLLAAGNFALGAYITYEEIEAYRTQLAAYKVNISDDEPNAVWVIIGVVGSVLDVAAVARISKTLVKAGRTFEETKDIVQTRKILDDAKLDAETKEKVIKALEKEKAKLKAKPPYNPEQHSEFIDTPHNLTDGMSPKFIHFKEQLEIAPLRRYLTDEQIINFKKAIESADPKVLNEINNQDKLINFVKSYKDNPKTFTEVIKSYDNFFGDYGWYTFWKKLPDFQKSSDTIDWLKRENKLLPIGEATHNELTTINVFTVDGGIVNTPSRFNPNFWGEYNKQIYKDLKIALEKLRKVPERNMEGKTVFSGRMESLDYFESVLKNGKGKEIDFKGMISSSLDEKVAEGFVELSARNVKAGEKVAIIRKIETVEGVYIDDLSDWGKNLGPSRHFDADPPSTMIQEEVLMNEGYFRQMTDPKYTKTIDGIKYYEIEFLELAKPLK